jgi:hypothetical protein
MIGTLELAKELFESKDWYADDSLMDSGWEFLDAGCTRYAWLAPDGVVYKIGTSITNALEHEAMASVEMNEALLNTLLGEGIHIPKSSLYCFEDEVRGESNVIAVEYVESVIEYVCASIRPSWDLENGRIVYPECDCTHRVCPGDLSDVMSRHGLYFDDVHSGNVFVDGDGELWIIDLG